jgi:hypothetical protein
LDSDLYFTVVQVEPSVFGVVQLWTSVIWRGPDSDHPILRWHAFGPSHTPLAQTWTLLGCSGRRCATAQFNVDWDTDVDVACMAKGPKPVALGSRPKEWLEGSGPIASRTVDKGAVLCSAVGRRLVLAAIALRRSSAHSDADRDAFLAKYGGDTDNEGD